MTDSPGLFAFGGLWLGLGGEEGGEGFVVFGEHAEELEAVAELGVGGDGFGGDEDRVGELQLEVEVGADGEGIHAFDVASVEAEVGGREVDGSVAALGVNLHGHADLESRMPPPFRRHGRPPDATGLQHKS